jgi:AbrB family looped-hinge helix DNA binding protein
LGQVVRVSKKLAIYIPKAVAEQLNISEGDKLLLEVRDGKIILGPMPKLLVRRRYWSEATVEEVEAESEELIKLAEGE